VVPNENDWLKSRTAGSNDSEDCRNHERALSTNEALRGSRPLVLLCSYCESCNRATSARNRSKPFNGAEVRTASPLHRGPRRTRTRTCRTRDPRVPEKTCIWVRVGTSCPSAYSACGPTGENRKRKDLTRPVTPRPGTQNGKALRYLAQFFRRHSRLFALIDPIARSSD